LYVGRLSEEKGLGLLLAAWDRHPAGVLGGLTVVGDGPLRSEVVAAAAARPDITYLGPQPQSGVREAMRAASTLVVPSTWDEVCPMVVVEALANARPALVTDKGGLPYLVGAEAGDQPAEREADRAGGRAAEHDPDRPRG
ncbi:MAG: glycosyltransferase, partial [Micromonosporaceae bacterium]